MTLNVGYRAGEHVSVASKEQHDQLLDFLGLPRDTVEFDPEIADKQLTQQLNELNPDNYATWLVITAAFDTACYVARDQGTTVKVELV